MISATIIWIELIHPYTDWYSNKHELCPDRSENIFITDKTVTS